MSNRKIPGMNFKFDRWIDELRESVIEGEYGFEPGEFSVHPELWKPMFREGLTPSAAFERALKSYRPAS